VTTARWIVLGFGALFGLVFVGILHVVLPGSASGRESYMAAFLLDRGSDIYPFSIQNLMWVIFYMGLGDLWIRHTATRSAQEELLRRYLPEDEETVLRTEDLAGIYRRLRTEPGLARKEFLARLIQKVILQFQISESVEQSSVLLNSSLELFMHEIELRYGFLRYLMWFIPTLGFIGTVLGISRALEFAAGYGPDTGELLPELTAKLGVAFFTTLLALILSGILVFLIHVVQSREERLLNESGHYCLDHLINRLYVKK
jgi:biopolymer transport protein ExbB/TolQ